MSALTVFIPAFNEEFKIIKCIDSILCQGIDGVSIVVLDDFSTDNTVSIVKSHKEFGKTISISESKIHIGAQLNLLRGVLCAETEFSFFMSANDTLIEGSLKKLIHYMMEHQDCAACYGKSFMVDKDQLVVGEFPKHFYIDSRFANWEDRCVSVASQYVWGGVQYALYRTSALQISYPHEARYGADHLFYFLLASVGEIHFIDSIPMRLENFSAPDSDLSTSIEKHKSWYKKAKGEHLFSSIDFDYEIQFPFISMIMAHCMSYSSIARKRSINNADCSKNIFKIIDNFCRKFWYVIEGEISNLSRLREINGKIFNSDSPMSNLSYSDIQAYLLHRKYIDFSETLKKHLLKYNTNNVKSA